MVISLDDDVRLVCRWSVFVSLWERRGHASLELVLVEGQDGLGLAHDHVGGLHAREPGDAFERLLAAFALGLGGDAPEEVDAALRDLLEHHAVAVFLLAFALALGAREHLADGRALGLAAALAVQAQSGAQVAQPLPAGKAIKGEPPLKVCS